MGFLLFVIVLGILIFVHEFGHFIVAKFNNLTVTEFGFGFPPKAKRLFKKGDTEYTLNWIPFGGFVRILGESPVENEGLEDKKGSFSSATRFVQAQVLIAGVLFNMLFAWLLLSGSFLIGFDVVTSQESPIYKYSAGETQLLVFDVLSEGPAALAGIQSGDEIVTVDGAGGLTDVTLGELISSQVEEGEIEIVYKREGEEYIAQVTPVTRDDHLVIGVTTGVQTYIQAPFFASIGLGFTTTYDIFKSTLVSFWDLIAGSNNTGAEIAGPVGIAGIVKDAAGASFAALLSLMAIISVNLAIINMIPFPALDGGRLLMVAIEAIRRKPLNPKFVAWANGIGFVVLILLMVVITVSDVVKLF